MLTPMSRCRGIWKNDSEKRGPKIIATVQYLKYLKIAYFLLFYMTKRKNMEQYWDCVLCSIENKGKASRCSDCKGKLCGRDRLLWEIEQIRRTRKIACRLSSVAAGLGQIYARRWKTGVFLGLLMPLALGLVLDTWSGFTYGHFFLIFSAVFLLLVAAVDARFGPRTREAPCKNACPADIDIPDYLQIILDEEYAQGQALIQCKIPLVGVIGRICPHPCETHCLRGVDGEPISILACKRFLADKKNSIDQEEKSRGGSKMTLLGGGVPSVGIVGSGPAGISCAYYLSILGASVTVYEADSVVGGRLATTIPDYRLPSNILKEEIQVLKDKGVIFCVDTPIGSSSRGKSMEDLLAVHEAVFLAIGAQESIKLKIPGAESFLDFQQMLRSVKLGDRLDLGKRVAVVGGGNAAMDVCRSALRLGAEEVHLLYRRSRDQMPAREDEVKEAMEEGVKFHFLVDPIDAVFEDGVLKRLVVRKMRLGEPDRSGRPRPIPIQGEDFDLDVDCVVPALGQRVGGGVFDDPALLSLKRDKAGMVWINRKTYETSLSRVYSGGDSVVGPGTAVLAMAHGRAAALNIYADLLKKKKFGPRLVDRRIRKPFISHEEKPQAKIREEMPVISLWAREGNFKEVEEGFREGEARREAGRCLQCHREL